MAVRELQQPQSRRRRGCLIAVLVVLVLVVLVIVGLRRLFPVHWDGWGDLRVQGVVVDLEGTPIGDARVTLILNPGSPGFQLDLRFVAEGNSKPDSWLSKAEPGAGTRSASREIGLARTDAGGSIDLVVGIWLSGMSNEPGEMPPYCGIIGVIVEADGYDSAYVSARSQAWAYDEDYDAPERWDSLGLLNLGSIVLQPATQPHD